MKNESIAKDGIKVDAPIDSIELLIEWYRDAIDHDDYTDMYGNGETEINKINQWIRSLKEVK